jgi:MoxR-like ATPase
VWVEGIAEPIVASRTERAIVAAMGGNPAADNSRIVDEALDLAQRVADAAEQGKVDVVDLGRRARRLLASTAEPEGLF